MEESLQTRAKGEREKDDASASKEAVVNKTEQDEDGKRRERLNEELDRSFKRTLLSLGNLPAIPDTSSIHRGFYGPKTCWFNEDNIGTVRMAMFADLVTAKLIDPQTEDKMEEFLNEQKDKYIAKVQDALASYHE